MQGPGKIDIFVPEQTAFTAALFDRVRYIALSPSAPRPYLFPTPEDIILLKLRWFAAGSTNSQQQWEDVLGVLQTQAPVLDHAYLRQWSNTLHLEPVLQDAYRESGIILPS